MEKSIDFKQSALSLKGIEEFLNFLHKELDEHDSLVLKNLPTPFNLLVNILPLQIKKRIYIESIQLIKFCTDSRQWIQEESEALNLTSIKKIEQCYEYLTHEIVDDRASTRLVNKTFFTDSVVFDVLYYTNFGELYQPIIVINEEGFVVYANMVAREMMKLSHAKIKRKKTNINEAIEFDLKKFFFNSNFDLGFHESSRYLETGYSVLNGEKEGMIQINVIPDRTYLGTGQRWIVYFQPVSIEISLQEKYKEQLEETSTASKLAYTDNLTGIPNLRCLNETLYKTIEDYFKLKRSFGLIMLDVDHFKKFNDTYGHKQGDLVLVYLAKCLESILRNGDLLARYGGEEFTIIVKDIDDMHSLSGFLERCLVAVRSLRIPHIDDPEIELKVTSSFGGLLIDCFDFEIDNVQAFADELFKESDRLLYNGKGKGRDCYIVGKYKLEESDSHRLLDFLKYNEEDISRTKDLDIHQFFEINQGLQKQIYINYHDDGIEQYFDLGLNFYRGEINFRDKAQIYQFHQYEKYSAYILKECQKKEYPSAMREKIELILNELFTNAFFNSKSEYFMNINEGESIRKNKHSAKLTKDAPIKIKWKLDKRFIRLEVVDHSGRLSEDVLNNHLFNNQVSEGSLENSDQGAGVGLAMVLQNTDVLFFDIHKGLYTRVLVQIDYVGRKNKESCHNKLCIKRFR
ncbi:GGDEF domain-containing protein [Bacteriovoracaceae bacterium]|nr:GGDEF domain-containing protein [Bacteriovoracaceae bacterium]